ncbi:MAG TPA: ABC-2 family transporter protein [Thermomicrobiales bacterium]|nr:ABC-2 family transporter protein [Thermomicrobiales bacterium]
MHALTVARTFFRLGLLNFIQYRADFFIAVLNVVISLGTQLIGLQVIFGQTTDLKGWSQNDMIVLVGIHLLVRGLLGLVITPSMQALMEGVRLGTFDFVLTKPVDSQLLASLQTVVPSSVTYVIFGLAVIAAGMIRLGSALTPGIIALFIVMMLAGMLIIYSFMLVLSTLAFWFVKLENVLVIFNTMFGNAGSWPITIYPGWLRASLTFVVPVAFAVTIPAESLTGRLTWATALGTLVLAAAFVTAARLFWRYALRHYTGASA